MQYHSPVNAQCKRVTIPQSIEPVNNLSNIHRAEVNKLRSSHRAEEIDHSGSTGAAMKITPEDALANTPKVYRNTSSRWPIKHPDTVEIVKLLSDRGINVDFNERMLSGRMKVAPRPYWEPIQTGRDYAGMLIRPEWGWD